jgi:hypothetical protein
MYVCMCVCINLNPTRLTGQRLISFVDMEDILLPATSRLAVGAQRTTLVELLAMTVPSKLIRPGREADILLL